MDERFSGAMKCVTFVLGAFLLTAGARGAEDSPPPEPLHAPRQSESPPHFTYYRRSRYEVWQYYGVDRMGYFRPRVILAPYDSSYFLYNGEALPWVSTHQRDFMP